ncbi:MAG: sugar phosphate isomerase/epimerase [Betaproteobacteria bacterium]|nr:MAG: sugar phosphate isomerase/epimerase [Betaproteobacteria bacterium]
MLALTRFAMNTNTLAGTLEEKLRAVKGAGFGAIVLSGADLVGHRDGVEEAVELVIGSGLNVLAFQMLHDFEGLSGHMLDYKIDIARSMFDMMRSVDAPLLIVASTTSPYASGDARKIADDLAMLGTLAAPPGIRIAFGALAWGRWINEYTAAWEAVKLANHANVGLAIDSFHVLARGTSRESFDAIPGEKIFLVQLSDYLWDLDDLIETARHRRVFPSEGNHNVAIVDLVGRLERAGYRGGYSFDVVNDEYLHLPAPSVAARGRKAATWLAAQAATARH